MQSCFYCRNIRTNQIGTTGRRNPKLIDNKKLYKRVVGGMIGKLLTRGPDLEPTKRRPSGGGYQRPNSGYGSPNVQQTPNTGYGSPTIQQTPNTGYGSPSVSQRPSTGYGVANVSPPSSGYGRPSNGPRPSRPRGQRKPQGGRPRPPRKIPPLEMPMLEYPKGHFSPPAPGGVIFQFKPKKRRTEGGFMPAAPYFKDFENYYKPNQLSQNNAFAYKPGTEGTRNNPNFILTPSVSSHTPPNPQPPNQFNPFNTLNTTPKPAEPINQFTPFTQDQRPQLLISTTPTPSLWNNQVQATNIAPAANPFQMANINTVASNISPTNQYQLSTNNLNVQQQANNNLNIQQQTNNNPINLQSVVNNPTAVSSSIFPEVPKNRPNNVFQTQESQIQTQTPIPTTSVTFKPTVQKGHSLANDVRVNDNNKNLLHWYQTLYEQYPELLDDNPQGLDIDTLARLSLNQNQTSFNQYLQQQLFNLQRKRRYQLLVKQALTSPNPLDILNVAPVIQQPQQPTQISRPVTFPQQTGYLQTNPISTTNTQYNVPIHNHVVSSSLSFGPSTDPNVVYGKALPPAQSRSDSSAQTSSSFPILNPRAASSIYTNRAPRTIPKEGIPTRFINNVPIRQWQWPDYT